MKNSMLSRIHSCRQILIPGLCLLISMWGTPAHAQDPQAEEEDVPMGSAPYSPTQAAPVFRANEAITLMVPLDTGSIFNGSYPIDSAGYVKLPVLGRLYIHGKTVPEVESYLGKKMSAYLKDINVMATPAIRLTLLGHWQKPAMVYVDPDALVWEACLIVGGPAGEKSLDKWKVRRGGSTVEVSLLDAFSRGNTLRQAGIASGDIFVIPVPDPQSGFWYWFRESLTVTAEIAGVLGAAATLYLTYLYLEDRLDEPAPPTNNLVQ